MHAAVFVLKHILHGFSDTHATKILTLLRDAASLDTQLLVVDSLLPYACRPDTNDSKTHQGGLSPSIPAFAPMAYVSDMAVSSSRVCTF